MVFCRITMGAQSTGRSVSSSPLFTPQGRAALAAASREADPTSLAAATRLRKLFAPEVAVAALAQESLRRKGRAKFGSMSHDLFLTPEGLEQASRPGVSAWRASRLAAMGIRHVVDLGCGIGADARAFLASGMSVTAVEIDPMTAEFARVNLPGADVVVGDAEVIGAEMVARAPCDTAVFLDPARRTQAGRTWRVADYRPSWSFVSQMLRRAPAVVKLGPGVPKEILPSDVECCWVSHRGDVVEASLWSPGNGFAAQLLPDDIRLDGDDPRYELSVAEAGRYLYEPDGAVIRSGLLDRISPDLWLLDPHVAYLSSDKLVESGFLTAFELIEQLPFDIASLKKWVKDHQVGSLEIKKRAIDLDPADLRRKLKPRGPNSATLILTRTLQGARAYVARRVMDS